MTYSLETLDYSVRVSGRARYARIVVRPDMSVEVVLPRGVHATHAKTLLREKEPWVVRSLNRFRTHAHLAMPEKQEGKPEEISFESTGQVFKVSYHKTNSSQVRVSERESVLSVSGCVDDDSKVQATLKRWLKRKGSELLLPMLKAESEKLGLSYERSAVRLQKHCWGSCSRKRSISLNAKLLFLPEPLIRYVMIHELTHLKEMNHSGAFWALVARYDDNCSEHRRALKQVSCWVPHWVER